MRVNRTCRRKSTLDVLAGPERLQGNLREKALFSPCLGICYWPALGPGNRPLFSNEALGPNPVMGQGPQVILVGTRDGVFFSPLDAQRILSRRPGLNLFNVGAVHDHGAMNSNESVWF